jgi:Subtilase family
MAATPPSKPSPTGRWDTSQWRDPSPPPKRFLDENEGRMLDPGTAMEVRGVRPMATTYVGPRLLISTLVDVADALEKLREVAEGYGWTVTPERGANVRGRAKPRPPRMRKNRPVWSDPGQSIGVIRVDIAVAESNREAVQAPDGWLLLQQARAKFGLAAMHGVGLDHIVFLRGGMWDPHPGMWDPHPGMWDPHSTEGAVSSYMAPGWGGRQPVAYAGPQPHRHPDDRIKGRRPVVAVLDTGCGRHPWLNGVVKTDVRLGTRPIGLTGRRTNPEYFPDQYGPLDGGIDPYSGHGTFICGLIHQACPDADILAWRAVDAAGPIVESTLIKALDDILALVERHRADPANGHAIDILSLSLGYYHETPEDEELVDPTVWELMRRFGEAGTVVVCSAGNDATARPMYPAAFGPWRNGGPVTPHPDALPIVAVGAKNPNGTDSLFSNAGEWVRVYETGAAVLSTLPPSFNGGAEPAARTHFPPGSKPGDRGRRTRESIDPDDFASGFALWSGTSFAAPLFAGKLAQALVPSLMRLRGRDADTKRLAYRRGWDAVLELTDIKQRELENAERAGAPRSRRRGQQGRTARKRASAAREGSGQEQGS